MSLDLTEMRALVRRGLGNLDDNELIDADVDMYLNLSLWELEDRFPFEAKKTRFRFSMTIGQSTYSLAPLADPNVIRSVAIIDADTSARAKLKQMTRDWYDTNVTLSSDTRAQPTRYMREDDCLFFNCDPDVAYVVELSMEEGVASIVEGTNEGTGLPRNWDELVVQGAIVRGQFYNEDYQRAQQASNFQTGGIRQTVLNSAKKDKDNSTARLAVLWDDPND